MMDSDDWAQAFNFFVVLVFPWAVGVATIAVWLWRLVF